MKFSVNKIKKDFPIFNDSDLVYLDNASTTQKPASVIDEIQEYYECTNSNIHRGVHHLSQKATEEYEEARTKIQKFIGAESSKEIVFVRGATEAVNLVANSYVNPLLSEGDNIIISHMEHHANIVPWQLIAKQKNIDIKVIPINEMGELVITELDNLIDKQTKFISLNHVSNSLGTVNPVEELIQKAHQNNIRIMIDGAQAVQHMKVNVTDLDVDFYCFSGHKMYGPTGVGILYGKEEILDKMPPYMGGGEMIKDVSFDSTTYNELPYKFEAGTPNIGDVVGFKKAIEFIKNIGRNKIYEYENSIRDYAHEKLVKIDRVNLVGTSKNKIGIFSFHVDGFHYYDLGLFLDAKGIAIRTGHHCTQPLMEKMKLDGTARVSLAMYNTYEEIDYFIEELKRIINK